MNQQKSFLNRRIHHFLLRYLVWLCFFSLYLLLLLLTSDLYDHTHFKWLNIRFYVLLNNANWPGMYMYTYTHTIRRIHSCKWQNEWERTTWRKKERNNNKYTLCIQSKAKQSTFDRSGKHVHSFFRLFVIHSHTHTHIHIQK